MKVRKIVAGLAAVSMLAAFSAQAVIAADTVSIKAGEASANAGEKFTLDVSLEGVPAAGISSMEFAVTYDPAIVTVTSVTPGKIADNGVESAEKFDGVKAFEAAYDTAGLVTITYSTGLSDAKYCITESGVYATISGTVAATAKDGDYSDIKITAIARETVEGKGDTNKEIKAGYIAADGTVTKYATSVTNGKVTVGTATTPSEEPSDTPSEEPSDTPSEQPSDKPTDAPSEQPSDTPSDQPTDTPVKPGDGNTMYGDANCDGNVDIMDVIATNKQLLGTGSLTEQGKINADVDLQNGVDTTDSLNILKCVVELIDQSSFPIK
jgi:hypothetical protein